jgi:hypothetical protein
LSEGRCTIEMAIRGGLEFESIVLANLRRVCLAPLLGDRLGRSLPARFVVRASRHNDQLMFSMGSPSWGTPCSSFLTRTSPMLVIAVSVRLDIFCVRFTRNLGALVIHSGFDKVARAAPPIWDLHSHTVAELEPPR